MVLNWEVWHLFSLLLSCCAVALTLYMLVRLYLARRNKSYLSFAGYLAFIILHQVYLIILSIMDVPFGANSFLNLFITLFGFALGFMLLNLGIYRLYNHFTFEVRLFFGIHLLLFAGCYIAVLFISQVASFYLLSILNLYLVFIALYSLKPKVNHRMKYSLAVIGISLYSWIPIISLISGVSASIITIFSFLSLFGYGIFFILIFERSVELMQLVYHSSITDGLTGLYNRKYFYSYIENEINLGNPLSAVFIDIDNFKRLNDTFGHQIGDLVLQEVANIASYVVGDLGIAARYGGEEIVLLSSTKDAYFLAETFRARIAEQVAPKIGIETPVTVSVGYNQHRPGLSPVDFIKQADAAMYHSKNNGKNQVTNYLQLNSD